MLMPRQHDDDVSFPYPDDDDGYDDDDRTGSTGGSFFNMTIFSTMKTPAPRSRRANLASPVEVPNVDREDAALTEKMLTEVPKACRSLHGRRKFPRGLKARAY